MLKKVLQLILHGLIALGLLALAFVAGFCYCKYNIPEMKSNVIIQTGNDLSLPTETERRMVTIAEIEVILSDISEFSTYSALYSTTKEADYTRFILDSIPIPGTTNIIHIECEGIVKVGYNINEIGIGINNKDRVIYISIPDAVVLDNYLIWDTVAVTEKNNILNPIDFSQYQELISEIEADGLRIATEQGIFLKAEENFKLLLTGFLAGLEYEIEFI